MANMKYKIIVSPVALKMLNSHIEFLSMVNPNHAKMVKKLILNSIGKISDFTYQYSVFILPGIPINRYRKQIIQKKYMVIYHIEENLIIVDYILDSRKKNDWLLKDNS